MAILGGPDIIDNGLVLSVDAANVKSYGGSGTTWNDLSGNNNFGTIANNPTSASTVGGSFTLNGTTQNITINSSANIPVGSSARTVSIWFATVSTSWVANVNNLFYYGTAATTRQSFGIDMSTFPSMEVWTLNNDFLWSTTFAETGWKNITVTYNGATTIVVYENGILTQTFTLSGTLNTTSTNLNLGSFQSGDYYDGSVANMTMYNRALTAQEVLQNFNATRSRFGV